MAGKRTKPLSKREKRKKEIKLIVQSNELVEARYSFDTWETRFFYSFVSMIAKEDDEDKVYRVWLSDVKKTYQLNNNDSYNQLRKASKSLANKNVYVSYNKDGVEREVQHRFIRCIDYVKEGQGNIDISNQEYIDVAIDKEILPLLLHVKKEFNPLTTRYTSYDERNIIRLKPYDVRIFQLLKKDEYKGHTILEFERLRTMLNMTDEYKRFSTFHQRVLEPAFKNINKHTDISVPLEEITKLKKGRKIYAIRVLIRTKTKKEIAKLRGEILQPSLFSDTNRQVKGEHIEDVDIIDIEIEEKSEVDILYDEFESIVIKDFGVTPSVLIKMLSSGKYQKEHIEQAINVTRRAKYKQEITKSVAGFFVKALKEGFTDAKEEQKKKQAQKEQVAKKRRELENEYATKKQERIKQLLKEDKSVNKKTLAYLKEQKNKALEVRLKKLGLTFEAVAIGDFREDKILRGLFIQGILVVFKEYFTDLDISYEKKIKTLKSEVN